MGNMVFKTFTKPDGTKETRAYGIPRKENGKFGYTRKTPLSNAEIRTRQRFTLVSRQLREMTDEQKRQYNREWKQSKYCFNGKKYATLRGYIMARLYAANKHPQHT